MSSIITVIVFGVIVIGVGFCFAFFLLRYAYPNCKKVKKHFAGYDHLLKSHYFYCQKTTSYLLLSKCHQVFFYIVSVVGASSTIITIYFAIDSQFTDYLLLTVLIAAIANILLLTVKFENISIAFYEAYKILHLALLNDCDDVKCVYSMTHKKRKTVAYQRKKRKRLYNAYAAACAIVAEKGR